MKRKTVVPDPPFFDEEERELIEDLRAGGYKSVPNKTARLKLAKKMAENTPRRRSITIRVQERVISDLKSIALEEGLPYQSLISSVLHKFVNGKLVERN